MLGREEAVPDSVVHVDGVPAAEQGPVDDPLALTQATVPGVAAEEVPVLVDGEADAQCQDVVILLDGGVKGHSLQEAKDVLQAGIGLLNLVAPALQFGPTPQFATGGHGGMVATL